MDEIDELRSIQALTHTKNKNDSITLFIGLLSVRLKLTYVTY